MTVDDWVLEALERNPKTGLSLREIQRYIDEHHYEELAVDTLEQALDALQAKGKAAQDGERWKPAKRTSKDDAMKKLFGDSD